MPSGYLCQDKGLPTDIFFPMNLKAKNIRQAKHYCSLCLRRMDCLNLALATGEEHGIFGGMTYSERIRYQVKEALKVSPIKSTERQKLNS